MRKPGSAVALAAALALVAAPDSWAGHHGGSRGTHRSAGVGTTSFARAGVPIPRPGFVGIRAFPMTAVPASTAPQAPFHHHHPGRTVIFIGAPFWYWAWPYGYAYLPPPYYYGPNYAVPQQEMPALYIEKFDGTPTPETVGDIFCPASQAYYPEVKDCSSGWQRIIREDVRPAADAG